jgi:cytochrome c oxidase subunit 4
VNLASHPLEPAPLAEHPEGHHPGNQPASDRIYVVIALVLGVLTALEVSLSYVDVGINTPLLFVLMAIKFVLVVLYFMHLKFDSKIFSYLFWTGAILAVAVYVAALACFHMFASS